MPADVCRRWLRGVYSPNKRVIEFLTAGVPWPFVVHTALRVCWNFARASNPPHAFAALFFAFLSRDNATVPTDNYPANFVCCTLDHEITKLKAPVIQSGNDAAVFVINDHSVTFFVFGAISSAVVI
jgi:hypothetical protein